MISLHIATWNINGLAPNVKELEIFMRINKLDVCLISESHTTLRSRICIRGFCVYLTSHPDGGAHAGTAIVIRENIKHCLLDSCDTSYLQATTVRIEDRTGPLILSAIYCPPRHNIKEFMFTDFFKKLGNCFIAGGDWNAKNTHWGSRLTTTRGKELKRSVECNHLDVMSTGTPTYWPTDMNKIPDLLDFFISKGICLQNMKIESSLDGSSDHTPVLLTVSPIAIPRDSHSSYLCNARTDWNGFRDYLDDNITLKLPLKTPADVDDACLYITNLIQVAAWINTPAYKTSAVDTPIPADIREKIMEKRRLRRVWHGSHNSEDKTRLNRATKRLKNLLTKATNAAIKERLESYPLTIMELTLCGRLPRSCPSPNSALHQLGMGTRGHGQTQKKLRLLPVTSRKYFNLTNPTILTILK